MSDGVESRRRPQLDLLQQWMQAVITHPGGIRSGIDSEEARRGLYVDIGSLESILAPSTRLSGAGRLAIYCRSYHARLLECFQSMFPALLHALGEEVFNRFALDYLQHHPPRSYTLDQLADSFPQHLAETRPDADAPPDERERWPDFIIDLALIELSFLKVYDGPGVEGRTPADVLAILSMNVASILAAHPLPAPCLRLFTFRYPVHTYLLAARRGENPTLPAPKESFIAMTRRNYRVTLHELSASQYAFLQALDGHRTVAQALNPDARDDGFRPPSVATIRDWLCDWSAVGFFERIEVQRETVHA